MPGLDTGNVFFPDEAARYLEITTQKLARLRRKGKIHGTQVGKTNLYTYTIADLKQANLQLERRGPKPKSQKEEKSLSNT